MTPFRRQETVGRYRHFLFLLVELNLMSASTYNYVLDTVYALIYGRHLKSK